MPRKRKTRVVAASKRAPAKVPDGNEGSDLEEENRTEKLDLLLKDFNVELTERIERIKSMRHSMIKKVELALKMELMKLPQNMKKMKLSEFIAKGGVSNTADKLSEIEKFEESLEAKVNAVKNVGLQPIEEEDSGNSKKTVRKGRQTRKNVLSANQGLNVPPPPTTNRTRRTRQAAKTPAQGGGPSRLGWETPLVTPKFNPKLPQTPATGLRTVQKGERFTLMSTQTGSPVAPTETTLLLPLGGDKTMMIAESDMDEETRQTIQRLREKLLQISSQ